MKKLFTLWGTLLSFLSFASAQYGGGYVGDPISGVNKGIQQIIFFIEALLGPVAIILLGGDGSLLFERVLFLAVIFSIVYIVISNMGPFKDTDKGAIPWIITIAVSLLSTRFLAESTIVQTMILPYSVLGVALTAALPLIIYFAFVIKMESSLVRKILWIFFIVVFIGLWGSRIEDLGSISWIYFWTAILALVFLIFDGTIQKAMRKAEWQSQRESSKEEHLALLREELEEVQERIRKGLYSSRKAGEKAEKIVQDRIKRVEKSKY